MRLKSARGTVTLPHASALAIISIVLESGAQWNTTHSVPKTIQIREHDLGEETEQ